MIEFSPRRDESLNNRETMSKSASTSWQRHRESLDSQLSNHRFDSPRHDQDLLLTPSVHHETLASSQRPMLGVTPSLTFGETLTTPTSTKHLHVGTGFCLPSEQQHTDSLVSASPDAVSGPRLRIHTISGTDEQASSIASTESDPFVDTGSYSIANLDNSFCPQSSSLKRSSSHISSSDLSSTSESFEVPISNDTRSEVRRKKHPTPSAIHWEILETTMTDYAHGRITQAEAEARVHKTAFASPRSRMKRARNSAHQTGNLLADRFEAEVDELQMEEVSFA